MKLLIALCAFCCIANINAQTFKYYNQPMGVVLSLAEDRDGNIYQGEQTGGVNISTDKGGTWNRIGGSTLGQITIHSLMLNRNGQIVAATEAGGMKIYTGNKTWVGFNKGLASGNIYPSLRAICQDSSGAYFVGARGWYGQPNGVYKANDSINGWQDISDGLPSKEINCLITNIDGKVYCGTEDAGVFVYENGKWVADYNNDLDKHINAFAIDKSGYLIAATNSGLSIKAAGSGQWSHINIPNNNYPILSITFDETQTTMIVGAGFKSNQKGSLDGKIFISKDGGNNWKEATGLNTLRVKSILCTKDGNLYAGAQGTLKSTDKGDTWLPANGNFRDAIAQSYGRSFAHTKNDVFFLGSEYGVWKSTDYGTTWKSASKGIEHPNVSMLYADSRGNLFAGCYAHPRHTYTLNKLYRSTNEGETWDTVQINHDDIFSEMTENEKGDLFIAHGFGSKFPSPVYGSGCSISKDGGLTWTDLPCFGGKGFSVAVTKKGTVLFGGETLGVFRSTDNGASWDSTIHVGAGGNMSPISVSPDGDIFTCAYNEQRIFFSDYNSDGRNYVNMTDPSFPAYTGANAFLWNSDKRMYVGLAAVPPKSALYYADPPWTANTKFTMIPNLPLSVTSMFWDKFGYMWIAGSGTLVRSDSILTKVATNIVEETDENTFVKVISSPENELFSIEYNLTNSAEIRLTLLNQLGEEISQLANEFKQIGNYRIDLSKDNLKISSGVYFVALEIDGKIKTEKLCLVK